jgi:L-threonylcarbamoyladenylate synthase
MALTLNVDPVNPSDRTLVLAAEVVQAGGVIVYPTDTIYGIGANALNAEAIAKVHAIKRRTDAKPILVLVPTAAEVKDLTLEVSRAARLLMDAFWPGPLTLVFAASGTLPPVLRSGGDTIGIRVPSSQLCLKLLRLCSCPITSTSANLSGEMTQKTVGEIRKTLAAGVDLYLDAGPLPESKPSTVVDVTVTPPRLLREGAVNVDRLRTIVHDLVPLHLHR